jgi:glycosyltransferase involved in cell wall biosynthesis
VKVLHVIKTLAAGGAERHLLALARSLRLHGVDVTVACLREGARGAPSLIERFALAGISVLRLSPAALPGMEDLVAVVRLARERPDLLHTHLPRADLLGALACGSRPWVVTVHGIYDTHWAGRRALPLFERLWFRAAAIVAPSEAVRSWLVDTRGLPAGRVVVVRHGIDASDFGTPRADMRTAWGLGGGPVIGVVGRLEPTKRHDVVIRAMTDILRKAPDARLLIAGADLWGYRPRLEALIRNLGLDRAVRLVGFVDDVSSMLHAVDVFVTAGTSEGFGLAVLEAMAAGKPVVAPRIAPLTEIVADGTAGVLVPPEDPPALADAVLGLLRNAEAARRMGYAGRACVAEHFTLERMARDMLGVYALAAGRSW